MDKEINHYQNRRNLLEKIEFCDTNIDETSGLEYNVDACSCMSCGCFKSVWTAVLSPAGIAAGTAAYSASAAL